MAVPLSSASSSPFQNIGVSNVVGRDADEQNKHAHPGKDKKRVTFTNRGNYAIST
jgi:hypothetical protein